MVRPRRHLWKRDHLRRRLIANLFHRPSVPHPLYRTRAIVTRRSGPLERRRAQACWSAHALLPKRLGAVFATQSADHDGLPRLAIEPQSGCARHRAFCHLRLTQIVLKDTTGGHHMSRAEATTLREGDQPPHPIYGFHFGTFKGARVHLSIVDIPQNSLYFRERSLLRS